MVKTGKRFEAAQKLIEPERVYAGKEAIGLVKAAARAKFDETIEAVFRLGVDTRKADQMLRGSVSLPAGSGKTVRVAVFAEGPQAEEAREAGAEVVGADDLIEQIEGGFLDFDATVATPDMMPKIGKVARTLGPRGLMPNPKTGTVTTEVGKIVSEIKGGKVDYRTDKFGIVHLIVGKASFSEDDLQKNFAAAVDEIIRQKPSSSKGKYIKSITISSSMGPGIKVDPNTTAKDLL